MKRLRLPSILACAALILASAACGGSVSSPSSDPSPDSSVPDTAPDVADETSADVPPDGPDPALYPAFPPRAPQIVKQKGPVIASPKVVTITFAGDPNADAYEAFGDALGGSAYWAQVTSEYGVGPATGAGHVRLTAPLPSRMTETDLDAWVTAQLTDAVKNGYPALDPNGVYVYYSDRKVALSIFGYTMCGPDRWGYGHYATVDGVEYQYAFIGQCERGHGVVDDSTETAAGQIASEATHPHGAGDLDGSLIRGWIDFDPAHNAWRNFDEYDSDTAGACELFPDTLVKVDEPAFKATIVKQWSNAAAKAGHDPCVPAPKTPYFNAVHLSPEVLGKAGSEGVIMNVGDTKTISFGLFSDAPTPAWNLAVKEGSLLTLTAPKTFDATIDHATGRNGDTVQLTVTLHKKAFSGGSYLVLASSDGTTTNYVSVLLSATK